MKLHSFETLRPQQQGLPWAVQTLKLGTARKYRQLFPMKPRSMLRLLYRDTTCLPTHVPSRSFALCAHDAEHVFVSVHCNLLHDFIVQRPVIFIYHLLVALSAGELRNTHNNTLTDSPTHPTNLGSCRSCRIRPGNI